jgi:hypothetical protein
MKFKDNSSLLQFVVALILIGVATLLVTPQTVFAKVECSDGSGMAEGDPGDGDETMSGGSSSGSYEFNLGSPGGTMEVVFIGNLWVASELGTFNVIPAYQGDIRYYPLVFGNILTKDIRGE